MEDENKTPEFVVPDEYKERGWTKMVQSTSDLWKLADNQATQLGKSQLPHKDASQEDLDKFVEKMKKYTSELDYSDITGNDSEMAQTLKDAGIPKFQAKKVIDLLNGRTQKEYNEEEWQAKLSEHFKGREKDLEKAKAVLKLLGEEESAKVLAKKNDDSIADLERYAKIGNKYEVSTADTMSKVLDTATPNSAVDYSTKGICKEYYDELNAKYYNNPMATEEDKRAVMRKYGILKSDK